jgi:TonB-linked SusC/RagA family outer membrane protein
MILMRSHFLLASFLLCLSLQAQDKAYKQNDSVSGLSGIDMRLYHPGENDKALFATEVSKQLLQRNNELSLFEILQGKISGLDIISTSGGPGRNATALSRGRLNYNRSTPLVVIDGIPQRTISNIPLINTNDVLQNLLPVSPEDILSVEILKNDPSALLYGADGANGVIYIETKKGTVHKPIFAYQFNRSFLPEPAFHKMLNGDEYIMYQLEALHNSGATQIPPEIAYDRDFSGFYNYSQNTDWVKAVTQPAHSSNHFLNVSGGNEKNLYYGSLSYNILEGSVINTGGHRLLNRLHFEHYFSKKFTVGVNFNYALYNYDDNVDINGIDILQMAHIKAPNMSIWEYDSMGNKTGEYFNPINSYQGTGSVYFNPIAVAERAEKNGRKNRLQGDLILNYNIKSWLTFRETLSFQLDKLKEKSYLPYNAMGTDWIEWHVNIAEENEVQESLINTESHLAFEAPFNHGSNHAFTGAITWIANWEGGEWLDAESNNIPSTDITDPAINGSNSHIFKGSWDSRAMAALTNMNYSYKDRYFVTGILRMDGYSLLGSDYRRSLYTGLSAGWRFSEEPWFVNTDFLNNGLIITGLSSSEYYSINDFEIPSTYQSGQIQNTPSFNLGIRLGLLSRINVEGTYYDGKSEYHSLSGRWRTKNTGWEGSFEYEALKQKEINWFLYFNLAHNKRIITDAPEDINNNEGADLSNGNFVKYTYEKRSPGSIYGLHYDGVYATDEDAIARDETGNIIYNGGVPVIITYDNYAFKGGDAKYRDVNYDGVIDERDIVYLGNPDPKLTGGFGSLIRYRGFSLNMNFHFRLGQKIILQEAMITGGFVTKNNHSGRVLNRWRVPGDQRPGMLPRAYLDHPANYLGSDLYVESGSYVRMNHLSLEYSFKKEWCQKFHLSELSLILGSQRPVTFTRSNALDPETNNSDEIRLYPPRVYTFSIRLGI